MRALTVLAITALLGLRPEPGDAPFEWRTDLGDARAEAAREGKPLLIVFR